MATQKIESTRIYIKNAKVQALRDAGITSVSKFVREKADEYIAARSHSSKANSKAATAGTVEVISNES